MKKFIIIIFLQLFIIQCFAQSIGIGTTTPAASAALEIKATDKGVLFPSLTTAQRDAIQSPASGLHIYNTDERCLNEYDGLFQIWDSYCNQKIVTILINQDVTGGIDFYNTYAKNYPGITRFAIIVQPGINVISGGYFSGNFPIPALNFMYMPNTSFFEIRVVNYGNILGGGGPGGAGARGANGDNVSCIANAETGNMGGVAIAVTQNIHTIIENYGIIAGGGGGGGGGGRNTIGQYGGGGGGGAAIGTGGVGGGTTTIFFGTCTNTPVAQNGDDGINTTGGIGGTGANGGGTGGTGGNLAQAGNPGTGTNAGAGGAAGITVLFTGSTGSSGIVINNHGSGQVLGTVQ